MSDISLGGLDDWTREESAFAVVLGLKRPQLRALRQKHLVKGIDWAMRGGKVTYYLRGEEKVRVVVSSIIGVDEGDFEVDESLGLEDRSERMEVRQVFPINRRLVECRLSNGDGVRVNVGDNANFVVGMELKARPHWGAGRLWVLVGRRPRWRGKW